ncbi:hypothetical protein TREMEDRAFT_61505 [Tremella mesenterica DSM 1558]|uniref:uncharacterized protein n=1 Tax=Tremella mesenterica (strain ATCC 24925 / CBS 8224 / DSM 1558 / NBRC 9311 / NRRL Y-6157 / RJB 2259-6 / UBC 559-6) TaxID=578456 RepID=UPI0003F498E9|nr:uncharacterized protein TREMEDRAFT_61505 [Tremella mesenterica DSM 1558]EIW69742.1 hypothetical protein TREMEDRAFT_61505 [Tremella mesenterica DSM 1558]
MTNLPHTTPADIERDAETIKNIQSTPGSKIQNWPMTHPLSSNHYSSTFETTEQLTSPDHSLSKRGMGLRYDSVALERELKEIERIMYHVQPYPNQTPVELENESRILSLLHSRLTGIIDTVNKLSRPNIIEWSNRLVRDENNLLLTAIRYCALTRYDHGVCLREEDSQLLLPDVNEDIDSTFRRNTRLLTLIYLDTIRLRLTDRLSTEIKIQQGREVLVTVEERMRSLSTARPQDTQLGGYATQGETSSSSVSVKKKDEEQSPLVALLTVERELQNLYHDLVRYLDNIQAEKTYSYSVQHLEATIYNSRIPEAFWNTMGDVRNFPDGYELSLNNLICLEKCKQGLDEAVTAVEQLLSNRPTVDEPRLT